MTELQTPPINHLVPPPPPRVLSSVSSVTPRPPCLPLQASALHQEKQGFIGSLLNSTLRFGKLQDDAKVSSLV